MRRNRSFRPALDRFERKQLLSVSTPMGPSHLADVRASREIRPAEGLRAHEAVLTASGHRAGLARVSTASAAHGERFTISRITNTSAGNAVKLVPPFQQVLVQRVQPVRGRVYNVLSVAVRNHTSQTFTAQDHFSVKLSGQSYATPVLTGDEVWKPGQFIVFYVLTHQYYPAHPEVSGGFEFDLGGSRGVAIPGPSGIFLRLPYRPATFARTLDWIVAYGPGAEGGLGPRYGLPDTQIWEFQRVDTAGSPGRPA